MSSTTRIRIAPLVLVALALLGALLAAGPPGLAQPADPTAGSADAPDAATNATADDGAGHVDGETPVVTSEPQWEPAATPDASGNDTVNSNSG